jgi:D-alanyl-D-alanine carboxypeptidase
LLLDTSVHDIKQLKLINVYTMQDLLSRYLIHDTPEEFHTFLIQTFQFSEKTASTITHLLHQWTKYNLDGSIENQKLDVMKTIN